MKCARLWAVAAVAAAACNAGESTTDPPQEPESVSGTAAKAVASANNGFAVSLYSRIADEQSDNLFFSPFSISMALAMTYAGADGATAAQMRDVMQFPLTGNELHASFAALRDQFRSAGGESSKLTIDIANRLWGEELSFFRFREAFLEQVERYYGAALEPLEFSTDPEGAAQAINGWTAEQTRDKITKLVTPQDVAPGTALVLTNAIYFKGDWAHPFEPKATKPELFYLDASNTVEVPMMRQKRRFAYYESNALQALEAPYAGERLSMVFLLPRERTGLAALEEQLTLDALNEWLKGLAEREVEAILPRFKLESRFSLAKKLAAMGMSDAFSANANFEKMVEYTASRTPQQAIALSDVIHKAYVDVNEEGTEAAAATGVIAVATSAMPAPPPVFRADHPFLFLIRDRSTGAILFLGRTANPAA